MPTEIENEIDLSSDDNEIKELQGIGKFNIEKNTKVWTNQSSKPITAPITAYVPFNILTLMKSIELKMDKKLEFGVFLKGELRDNCLFVSEEFLVLKQKVTSATIDFLEDSPVEYNGVIHRHPSGCTRFSGVDGGSININYEFSLLYVNNNITYGIVNLWLRDGGRIQVELNIKIIYPVINDLDNIMHNIEEEKHTFPELSNKHLYRKPFSLFDKDDKLDKDDDLLSFDDLLNSDDSSIVYEEEEPEQIYQLGKGFYYDGDFIYNSDHEILYEHELPKDIQIELIRIMDEKDLNEAESEIDDENKGD